MIRRPPRSTRTDTLFPYTTRFRSVLVEERPEDVAAELQRGIAIPLQRAQRASVDLDLAVAPRPHHQVVAVVAAVLAFHRRVGVVGAVHVLLVPQALQPHRRYLERNRLEPRSEERRVGKGCGSQG